MIEVRMSIMPQTFILVGCGGTGSRLVPLLAQFVKTCPWIVEPIIYLVDNDVVEQKNLLRQNFILPDVGKFKAEVLASRYSKAYNITIVPITKRVGKDRDIENLIFPPRSINSATISGNLNSTMVISCVDTMEARQNILNCFMGVWSKHGIFLDGGNEDFYGQVMVSNPNRFFKDSFNSLADMNKHFGLPDMLPVTGTANYIPLDLKFYSKTADKPNERSCADLDQTMAINSMVATTMFSVIQTIVYSRPINYYRLNITMAGIFPELLSMSNIYRLLTSSKEHNSIYSERKMSELLGNFSPCTVATYVEGIVDNYNRLLLDKEKQARELRELIEKTLVITTEPVTESEVINVIPVPPLTLTSGTGGIPVISEIQNVPPLVRARPRTATRPRTIEVIT